MNSFSLLLALRYLRNPQARSERLYIIPFVPLALFVLVELADQILRRAEPPFSVPIYWTEPLKWGALLLLLLAVGVSGQSLVHGHPRPRWLRVAPSLAWALTAGVGLLALVASAKSPALLSFHASAAAAIGTTEWALAILAIGSLVFVSLLMHLTIFATIATFAMFLGCAALVIVMSVMSGFEGDIKRKILGSHAHVVVTRPEEAFTDSAERIPQIAKTKGVMAVTPELSGEAMISSPANRSNVIVHGVDPRTLDSVTAIGKKVEVGTLDGLSHPDQIHGTGDFPLEAPGDAPGADGLVRPDPEERKRRSPPGILVGRELAKSLRIYLGDDVSLVSPTGGIGPSGVVPKARPYRVAGIFYTGMFEYDSKFVYVTLPSAQKLFDQADEVTSLEVRVPDADRTDEVVGTLGAMLGPSYEVQDWKALNRSLFSALALEKIVMFIFLSFIILVAAFAMVANGHMIATRKTAEIAMLKSMGATNGAIAEAFFWLSSFLGLLGVALGVSGGVLFAYALERWGYAMDPEVFYLTQLPVRLETGEVLVVALAGLAVSILATIHPVWAASRLTPVEGLREGGR